MKWKKAIKALLFPHIAAVVVLIPVSAVFLAYTMIKSPSQSPISIASYVLAAYTLTVCCCKFPDFIRFVRLFKENNTYVKRWQNDDRFHINVTLTASLLLNTAYSILHMGLGFYHMSAWYFSLSAYYISLVVMRFLLVRYTSRYTLGERIQTQLNGYRTCGIIFLVMNVFLSAIIFFMVYRNRTFIHHEITTIAMAAYTFTSFTLATVNAIKNRKHGSPVYSASKAINLAAAAVSMLTLESTMLTTFDNGSMTAFTRRLLLGISGGAVSVFIISMAVYMIVVSAKKLKNIKNNNPQVNS